MGVITRRFVVVTSATETIIAEARKRGMPEGEDCCLDYVEPDDFAIRTNHTTFLGALVHAQSLGDDFFGCPRIYEEERVERFNDPDDTIFVERKYWDIVDGEEARYDEPTHVYEGTDE